MKQVETDTSVVAFVRDLGDFFSPEYHLNPFHLMENFESLSRRLTDKELSSLWNTYKDPFPEPSAEMQEWIEKVSKVTLLNHKMKAFRKLKFYILNQKIHEEVPYSREPDQKFLDTEVSTDFCSEKLYRAIESWFDFKSSITFRDICRRKQEELQAHPKFTQKVRRELNELLEEYYCSLEMV